MAKMKQQGVLMEGLKQEFVYSMQARKLSGNTINNYGKLIDFLLRYAKEKYNVDTIEEFSSQIIKEFLVQKMATCKPQYVNDLLMAFKVLFRYIHEEGYAADNLTNRIENVKQTKVKIISFNKHDIKGMIDFYKGRDFLSVRNKTLVALLFDTGARCAEMCQMKSEQIKQHYILIYGKSNKEHIVPITPYLGKMLIKYIYVRQQFLDGVECHYLFHSKKRKVLTEKAKRFILKEVAGAIKAAMVGVDVMIGNVGVLIAANKA